MTDRGIPFTPPMVRALLDGRKTQTRRILKDLGTLSGPYAPGDRLWVKEAFRTDATFDKLKPSELLEAGAPVYWDCEADWSANRTVGRYRHARFMPRWASRLTLAVTDVRVQRLQDISEADAIAEGIEKEWCIIGAHCNGGVHQEVSDWRYYLDQTDGPDEGYDTAVDAYRVLWKSLHGPDAWDANPWVVAVTFAVRQGNIDERSKT